MSDEDKINELLMDAIEELHRNIEKIRELLSLPKYELAMPSVKALKELKEYARQSGEFPRLLELLKESPQRTKYLIKLLPVIGKVLVPGYVGTIRDLQQDMGLFFQGTTYDQIRGFLNEMVILGFLMREQNSKGAYIFTNRETADGGFLGDQ